MDTEGKSVLLFLLMIAIAGQVDPVCFAMARKKYLWQNRQTWWGTILI